MANLRAIWSFVRAFFISRADLAAENVMLRQQLIITNRSAPRPKRRRRGASWPRRIWAGCITATAARHSEGVGLVLMSTGEALRAEVRICWLPGSRPEILRTKPLAQSSACARLPPAWPAF